MIHFANFKRKAAKAKKKKKDIFSIKPITLGGKWMFIKRGEKSNLNVYITC